mmetsp:Transcript_42968/g.69241  ORF Transcript_42968/g.69241 Transcript_42968/m.69241 type:complete len:612 (+) Transcript_42968:2-1837(+)
MEHQYEVLGKDLRSIIAQALIQLCNRDMVSRFELLPIFFKLFRCKDKALRSVIYSHVVNDVVRLNRKAKDQKMNKKLQSFFLSMLKGSHAMGVKKSLDVIIDLWSRKIWNDSRTVNAVADMCFSPIAKVKATACRFFLGLFDYKDEDNYSKKPEASVQLKDLYCQNASITHVKRRKKRLRKMERTKKKIEKMSREEEGNQLSSLAAIDLLYDPQSFSERLFSQLKKSTDPFELRLLMMNVISRLIGAHRLIILNFYPFLQKYLHAGQTSVTRILAYLAQASHSLVPPEDLEPVIRSLADNFVSDRSSPEVMAVGLNAIREIAGRCPLAMSSDLLQDLVQYKTSKAKGVMMAARSLISTFRMVDPSKLHRKDRGKNASMNPNKQREYGQEHDEDDEKLKEMMTTTTVKKAGDGAPSETPDHQEEPAKKQFTRVRFLTAKDFHKLKVMREQTSAGRKRRRSHEEKDDVQPGSSNDVEEPDNSEEEDDDDEEMVIEGGHGHIRNQMLPLNVEEGAEITEDAIIGYVPRKKMTKEERRECAKEGREGVQKKWAMRNPTGTTNREKLKNKPFLLAKHSSKIRKKKNLSYKEQQQKTSAHIKGLKKLAKKRLRSMRG